MAGLAAERGKDETVMIDATYLKAHRTAISMGLKMGGGGRLIGWTKCGTNTKLRAICDCLGRPLNLFVTAGQVSDDIWHGHRWAAWRTSIACSEIAVTMPIGSVKR